MKIIGIIGSPRKKGNTEIMVMEAVSEAKRLGAEVETIHLGDLHIQMCDGCLSCDKTGICHFKDDMNDINNKLEKADALIIGTPTRNALLSGNLKVFLDRTNPLSIPQKLANKKVGIIAVGQLTDEEAISIKNAAQNVRTFCEDSGMLIIETVIGEGAYAPSDIRKNEEVLKKCRKLGEKIVSTDIKCQ